MLYSSKCIVIIEASSSRTSLHTYHPDPSHPINMEPVLHLDHKISDYAKNNNSLGFSSIIHTNNVIQKHLATPHCIDVDLLLLATGGMRDVADVHGKEMVDDFYKNISAISANSLTNLEIARTITGEEEGRYAWTTLAKDKESNDHTVFDLGGQTGQIVNQTHAFSAYLGKQRAVDNMGSDVSACYNDHGKYNGKQCRINVEAYLAKEFTGILPRIDHADGPIYVISNFENYFNDLCKTYLPYIIENNLVITPETMTRAQNLCSVKQYNCSVEMTVNDYQIITDEICIHWGDWKGKQAHFARDACFSGNYNYQILRAVELQDEFTIYTDCSGWAIGAAMEYINVAEQAIDLDGPPN